ncbi:MAG: nitroreductase family deazaflavin-dependent oxidoreductase [Anaerolineae bacterium]|nr:nitroreductase family deazaflavin-dependent oxidoreductase [Anaerolineae bacterium]MCI0608768.1 nitroreductase family deazaflavin-dependent oxidoreductase [Anaerolineae bacterium]
MTIKPNAFQKLIHQFIMLRPVTAFFADKVHLIDKLVLNLTGGKCSISEFAGWTIIQLTTIGAKTGRIRTSPLIGLIDRDKIAIIGSGFGRAHTPGWYYNLKAYPQCKVELKGRSGEYIARETSEDEYEQYWQLALSYYAGYEKYKERAAHRHIPVMVLEPNK